MTDIIKFSPSELDDKKMLFSETLEYVNGLKVRDEDELKEANETLKLVKAEAKAIVEMKTSATKPMNEALATVRSWFAPLEKLCSEVESVLKQKIADQTLALRKKAEEDAQKLLAAADSSDYNTLTELVQTSTTAPVLQGTSVREVWTATIAYPNTVPRTWCVPDEKRIAEHARRTPAYATPEPIAGVTFNKKSIVTSR